MYFYCLHWQTLGKWRFDRNVSRFRVIRSGICSINARRKTVSPIFQSFDYGFWSFNLVTDKKFFLDLENIDCDFVVLKEELESFYVSYRQKTNKMFTSPLFLLFLLLLKFIRAKWESNSDQHVAATTALLPVYFICNCYNLRTVRSYICTKNHQWFSQRCAGEVQI